MRRSAMVEPLHTDSHLESYFNPIHVVRLHEAAVPSHQELSGPRLEQRSWRRDQRR